jgi:hypothetical protein
MPSPALGTQVLWHSPNGYDILGLVIQTHDTWNAAMTTVAENAGNGVTAPADGQAHLVIFDAATQTVSTTGPYSEGTGSGQWSLA